VIGTQGFYIDVTRSDALRESSISEAVAEFAEHRAAIEQAKGVLMYVYRIDAAAPFDLLKWARRKRTPNCAPWQTSYSRMSAP